jgi:hypothetical protein
MDMTLTSLRQFEQFVSALNKRYPDFRIEWYRSAINDSIVVYIENVDSVLHVEQIPLSHLLGGQCEQTVLKTVVDLDTKHNSKLARYLRGQD